MDDFHQIREVPELAAALASAAADLRFGPSPGAAVKSITRWQGAGTPHCCTVHRNHRDVSAVCLAHLYRREALSAAELERRALRWGGRQSVTS